MLQETYLQSYLKNYEVKLKAAFNTKDGHTKCWFNLVNKTQLIKKIYLRHYFWQHNVIAI